MMYHFAAPLFVTSKDHLACRCLQNAGYRRVYRLSNHLSRIVDNDHCSVIQVSDALIEFLAFLQNEHLHRFPRQVNGLQRVGKLVDIEDFDAAKLRDLIQIEIVRNDLRLEFPGEFDQLHIHFANSRIVVLDELHSDPGHFLNSLKNIQAAAPAIALQRISRIGNLLKFAQDEMGNQQDAIHEPCFADVCDAPIDNHAGVENLVDLLDRTLSAKDTAERRQVEEVSLVGANHHSDVGHQEQYENHDEGQRVLVELSPFEDVTDHQGANDSHDRTDGRSDQSLQRGGLEPVLEINDAKSPEKAQRNRRSPLDAERFDFPGCAGEYNGKNGPDQNEIQNVGLLLLDLYVEFRLGWGVNAFGLHGRDYSPNDSLETPECWTGVLPALRRAGKDRDGSDFSELLPSQFIDFPGEFLDVGLVYDEGRNNDLPVRRDDGFVPF